MNDKEKQNISMKEMLTKRSVEPITNCNCKIESRIDYAVRNENKVGAFANLLNQEIEELQKSKAIEEMAKDLKEVETDVGHILINETFSYVKEHKKYNPKKDFSNTHSKTFEELTAEEMFKKGYRKNTDSVVLSREEYVKEINEKEELARGNIALHNEVDALHRINYELKEELKQARKGMAEKIYLQAKAIVDATKHIVQGREYLHIGALKEIVKSCGVEIKE